MQEYKWQTNNKTLRYWHTDAPAMFFFWMYFTTCCGTFIVYNMRQFCHLLSMHYMRIPDIIASGWVESPATFSGIYSPPPPLVLHIYVCELVSISSSHYLNQCWLIVNWNPRKTFQWFSNRNYIIFIQKCVWNCRMPKWRPLCPGGDEYVISYPKLANDMLPCHPDNARGCTW